MVGEPLLFEHEDMVKFHSYANASNECSGQS